MKKETLVKEQKNAAKSFEKIAFLTLARDILKKDRDRNIILKRYGLNGIKPKTLEAIGKELGITRERVRQIEKSALTKIEKTIPEIEEIAAFHEKLENELEKCGGFVNETRLISLFLPTKEQTPKEVNGLLFLTMLDGNLTRYIENKEFKAYWIIKKSPTAKEISSLSKKVDQILEKNKKVMSTENLAEEISKTLSETQSLLWIKKSTLQTDDRKWGLTSWREVNPKSIRDKTYVIMKTHKEPLHFSDIAQKISEHKMQKRPVTKQAVHNELIRDERFVLIGRGIYALSEWGYKPGVVEEVIKEILRTEGRPMHKSEIIKHVKKHRIVKETTITLNLQKNSFKRVRRATYTLAE